MTREDNWVKSETPTTSMFIRKQHVSSMTAYKQIGHAADKCRTKSMLK